MYLPPTKWILVDMKIVSGFDRKYGWVSRVVLVGFVFASVMMLIVAALGKNGPTSPGPIQAFLFPIISLGAAIWAYAATLREARSFHYFAAAVVAFGLGTYGFGSPWTTSMLIGVPALVIGVATWLLGERADQMDVGDDF